MDFRKSVSIANLVPYTGAKKDVDLGGHNIQGGNLSGTNSGDQDLSGLVPYSGATGNVDLGSHGIAAANVPDVSCASMYNSQDQTAAASNWDKLTLDTVVFDVLEETDLANSRITVTQAGYYLAIGSAMTTADFGNENMAVAVMVNGSEVAPYMVDRGSGNYASAIFTQILHLNAGDYVELFFYNSSGNDVTIAANYNGLQLRKVL